MKNETKKFTLRIPYANTAARKKVKAMGGVWNPYTKVWTVESTEYKIVNIKNLGKFIVNEIPTPKMVNSGAGFYMEDTQKNRDIVSKYGFDAIELI